MPRKVQRTKTEIDGLLADAGLELAEDYHADESYPLNRWLLTRCKKCGTVAHYRIAYIKKPRSPEVPTCKACHWMDWLKDGYKYSPRVERIISSAEAVELADKNGFDLVQLLEPGTYGEPLFLVKCQVCGRQIVKRGGDLPYGCDCQQSPNTSAYYAPPVKREVLPSLFDWEPPVDLSIAEAEITPVSSIPELMEHWTDSRDPNLTMVYPTGWYGMGPGDGQYSFTCDKGHHINALPYSYLMRGCPACRAAGTRGTGLFLADTSPELAAEWLKCADDKYTPENVRENSKRQVVWRCLACGHEWETSPRKRSKKTGQRCPSCKKIMGSIAWLYPSIAAEWAPSNPVSAWQIRPHTKTAFNPLWICSKNPQHTWNAQVASRVSGGECPECVDTGKSRVELKHCEAARKLFGEARSGVKYTDDSFSNPWTVDISVRYDGHKVAIEYDGAYWHKDKSDVDRRKSLELIEAGFWVVRIREDGLDPLDIVSPYYAEVPSRSGKGAPAEVLTEVLAKLEGMP